MVATAGSRTAAVGVVVGLAVCAVVGGFIVLHDRQAGRAHFRPAPTPASAARSRSRPGSCPRWQIRTTSPCHLQRGQRQAAPLACGGARQGAGAARAAHRAAGADPRRTHCDAQVVPTAHGCGESRCTRHRPARLHARAGTPRPGHPSRGRGWRRPAGRRRKAGGGARANGWAQQGAQFPWPGRRPQVQTSVSG